MRVQVAANHVKDEFVDPAGPYGRAAELHAVGHVNGLGAYVKTKGAIFQIPRMTYGDWKRQNAKSPQPRGDRSGMSPRSMRNRAWIVGAGIVAFLCTVICFCGTAVEQRTQDPLLCGVLLFLLSCLCALETSPVGLFSSLLYPPFG
jgi:hypothetical protein